MNDRELEELFDDLESDRTERKASDSDRNKIRQAVCAFANDLPNCRSSGVIFVGVNDDGSCADFPVTDDLLLRLSDMRSDGNILPFPVLTVSKKVIKGCEVAVVIVEPADAPPVRFNSRTWVRVGPRRASATAEEERPCIAPTSKRTLQSRCIGLMIASKFRTLVDCLARLTKETLAVAQPITVTPILQK